jgi:hypothetical protein
MTSLAPIASAALIVSSFGSPGPAPIKKTLPVDLIALFQVNNAAKKNEKPTTGGADSGFVQSLMSLKLC